MLRVLVAVVCLFVLSGAPGFIVARHAAIAAAQDRAPTEAARSVPVSDALGGYTRGRSFPVYDALGGYTRGRPDLVKVYGLKVIHVVYSSSVFGPLPGGVSPALGWPQTLRPEDERRLTDIGAALERSDPGSLVCLDIEQWPITGPEAIVRRSVDDYVRAIRVVKQAGPSLQVGLYGIFPWSDFHLSDAPDYAGRLRAFDDVNQLTLPITQSVDVVMPSLYAYPDSYELWLQYADAALRTGRLAGKPMYPFIWPEYFDGNKSHAGTFLPPEYWSQILEFVYARADGAVLWSGNSLVGRGGDAWNDDWEWWRIFRNFSQRYRL